MIVELELGFCGTLKSVYLMVIRQFIVLHNIFDFGHKFFNIFTYILVLFWKILKGFQSKIEVSIFNS